MPALTPPVAAGGLLLAVYAGQMLWQLPVQLLAFILSPSNRYRVMPLPSTRYVPSLPLLVPIDCMVAGALDAGALDDAVDAAAVLVALSVLLLLLLLPQPVTITAATAA